MIVTNLDLAIQELSLPRKDEALRLRPSQRLRQVVAVVMANAGLGEVFLSPLLSGEDLGRCHPTGCARLHSDASALARPLHTSAP